MNKDTRITVALALVYFLNGLFNLGGPGGSFAPMVVYDSFLLGVLGLAFALLPAFKPVNLLFFVLATCFILQGCFVTGVFKNAHAEIALNITFILICACGYVYSLLSLTISYVLAAIPLLAFVFTLLLGYFDANVYLKMFVSIAGAFVQVLLLAQPRIIESMPVLVKRFYLLMTIMVFFDVVGTSFLLLNMN